MPRGRLGCGGRYLFRAIDQFGQVIDVYLSSRRDAGAARRFFGQALDRTRTPPVEVTTDRYRVYPRVLAEMLPAAFHETEVHANNPIETELRSRDTNTTGVTRGPGGCRCILLADGPLSIEDYVDVGGGEASRRRCSVLRTSSSRGTVALAEVGA